MREVWQLCTGTRDLPRMVAQVATEELPEDLVEVYLALLNKYYIYYIIYKKEIIIITISCLKDVRARGIK